MLRIQLQPRQAVTILVLSGTLAGCSSSDRPDEAVANAPRDAASAHPTVPPGTILTFAVGVEVSTEEHQKGEAFLSTLTSDAMGIGGRPTLPGGTMGRWRVRESTSDNGKGEAMLVVGLDAVFAGGEWHPVEATVISTEFESDDKDSGKKTAAKIGIGTAAGALAGRILGKNREGALRGAVVGAAMGTAVALSTRGASVTIPEGGRITVRLDGPLVLGGA